MKLQMRISPNSMYFESDTKLLEIQEGEVSGLDAVLRILPTHFLPWVMLVL